MDSILSLGHNELQQFFRCGLCCGLLIDAVALPECHHHFCKSCIVKYCLVPCKGPVLCPNHACRREIHKARPFSMLKNDTAMQALIYKLYPTVYKEEMASRRDYYSTHPECRLFFDTTNGNRLATLEDMGTLQNVEWLPRDVPSHLTVTLSFSGLLLQGGEMPSAELSKKSITAQLKNVCYHLSSETTIEALKQCLSVKLQLPSAKMITILMRTIVLEDEYTLADSARYFSCKEVTALSLDFLLANPSAFPDRASRDMAIECFLLKKAASLTPAMRKPPSVDTFQASEYIDEPDFIAPVDPPPKPRRRRMKRKITTEPPPDSGVEESNVFASIILLAPEEPRKKRIRRKKEPFGPAYEGALSPEAPEKRKRFRRKKIKKLTEDIQISTAKDVKKEELLTPPLLSLENDAEEIQRRAALISQSYTPVAPAVSPETRHILTADFFRQLRPVASPLDFSPPPAAKISSTGPGKKSPCPEVTETVPAYKSRQWRPPKRRNQGVKALKVKFPTNFYEDMGMGDHTYAKDPRLETGKETAIDLQPAPVSGVPDPVVLCFADLTSDSVEVEGIVPFSPSKDTAVKLAASPVPESRRATVNRQFVIRSPSIAVAEPKTDETDSQPATSVAGQRGQPVGNALKKSSSAPKLERFSAAAVKARVTPHLYDGRRKNLLRDYGTNYPAKSSGGMLAAGVPVTEVLAGVLEGG